MKVQKRLHEISSSWFKGQNFKKIEIVFEGKNKCIHYGELFSKYGAIIDSVSSMTDAKPVKLSEYGDILFPASDVTPTGLTKCSAILEEGVILGGDIIVMRLIDGLNPVYVSYAIRFQKEQLLSRVTGALIKHISARALQTVSIPIVDINIQKAFEQKVRKLTSIIEKRKQQLQKLDELVKARFVEMFVKKDVMDDWAEKKIMDISTDMRTGPFGSALLHDEFVDSGIFVLGIDNAVENKFSYNRMRYITEEKYQQLKRYTVNPDDVIITIMGTVGRSAVIPRNIPRAINTKHLACITLDRDQANPYFLSCAFQIHPVIRTQLQKQSKGAIMDGLNLTIIKRLSFSLPPIDLQEQFVNFYNQIDKSKVAVQQALDKTQQLFDSLMQEYFG